ncbi:MAG TPA: HAD family phosphatase [Solirubrobacteraceae bacterium]|nr:HAD family phosphatase [Solirubrobacteraceae bacterium]
MITTVVSDLGGVLTTPLLDAFVAYSEHCGVELMEFWTAMGRLTEDRGSNPMADLEVGHITEPEFIDLLGGQIARQLGRPVDITDFSRVWFSHLLPNEPMLGLMSELRDRGLRMGLLTNNVREWEPLWRPRLPIDEIFGVIVDSGFVGLRKPDPAIYRLTQERLAVAAEEILFIDDMEVNITAASAAGWQTVQFETNDQAIPEIRAALAPAPETA